MLDKMHLEFLKKAAPHGFHEWNMWREKNPQIVPALAGANLSRFMLHPKIDGLALNLRGADLRNADLTQANLGNVDLSGANLENATLNETSLNQADLRSANLKSARLRNTNFCGANLVRTNLSNVNCWYSFFTEADLSEADLSNSVLINAELNRASLSKADLTKAELLGLKLKFADFKRANLIEASLQNCDIRETDFSFAKLTNARLILSQPIDAKFSHAELTGITIHRGWNCIDTNLTNITCKHVFVQHKDRLERLPSSREFEVNEFSKLFQADPLYNRLPVLESAIVRFEKLLNEKSEGKEKEFHDFLDENRILLDAYGTYFEKDPRWECPRGESLKNGKKYVKPDFVIMYPGNRYKLVELEKPAKPINTKQGQSSHQVTQSIYQLTEWNEYIRRFPNELKDRYPEIWNEDNWSGMIVIGRKTSDNQSHVREYRYPVFTYDDLLDQAKQILKTLSSLSI